MEEITKKAAKEFSFAAFGSSIKRSDSFFG